MGQHAAYLCGVFGSMCEVFDAEPPSGRRICDHGKVAETCRTAGWYPPDNCFAPFVCSRDDLRCRKPTSACSDGNGFGYCQPCPDPQARNPKTGHCE
jgi:hypothetical protein